jgi:glycosyltransferase involved in cell wall biosynthesis
VIVEAQASGLPVVAVAEGGPVSLICDGDTGLLTPADAEDLAQAVKQIVDAPLLAERLRRASLAGVRGRTWEAALERLAAGYRWALADEGQDARQIA